MELWHTLSPTQAAVELDADLEHGLTSVKAHSRLERFGANKLPEPATISPASLFFDQFKSVMTILLIAAALIAFFLGDELEAAAILVVLLLNALLGFLNEFRAERSVQALKALAVPHARVVRDRRLDDIEAADLVPGDLIAFEAGDRIPADARLIEAWSLRTDESALTGESVAADKDSQVALPADAPLAERLTMVYTGTAVVQGRGRALVTATGAATEVGKISALMGAVGKEQTPLQERLDRLGRYLAVAALIIAALMVGAGLLRGESFLPMLETSLALAIAAVPEGLPAVATIALALGMRRMAERKAIVRKLAAVETLGSTNVICTDKTGTLTQNQMTVREFHLGERVVTVTGAGYEPKGEFKENGRPLDAPSDAHLLLALRAGALCNNASLKRVNGRWDVVGDPTEGALVVAAAKASLIVEAERGANPKTWEIPFDARGRRMATVHRKAEGGRMKDEARPSSFVLHPSSFVVAKGAPEAILPSCTRQQRGDAVVELTEEERARLWQVNGWMAQRALRVLALAYKPSEREDEELFHRLVFLGFVGMIDPPRLKARESVRQCQDAGMRVVMITGDQKTTAHAIAQDLGIVSGGSGATVVDGQILDRTDDAQLRKLVAEAAVYARVSPEHKLRIVSALQARGEIVAMTGDGVNDAPALAAADIGVAMGRMGTDVARQAADMVLADDNFATIVAAVEEGRVVFANVRKFVHYLFSCNLSEILTMFVATMAGLPMPLLPLQILWLNLVTDVFPALALAGEPAEKGIMQRPPPEGARLQRPPASFIRRVVSQGSLLALATLAAFIWALQSSGEVDRAMTVAFLTLGFAQLFHVFNSRFETGSAWRQELFGNRYVWFAIGLTAVLMIVAVYVPPAQTIFKTVPPTRLEWVVVILAALLPALTIELWKMRENGTPVRVNSCQTH